MAQGKTSLSWDDTKLRKHITKATVEGFRSGAGIVAERAKANLAPHRRTGKTAQGIDSKAGEKNGKAWAFIKSEYPGFQVEEGHKARDGTTPVEGLHFLRAAMEQSKGEIFREIKKAAK